jgi:hypothetical protein
MKSHVKNVALPMKREEGGGARTAPKREEQRQRGAQRGRSSAREKREEIGPLRARRRCAAVRWKRWCRPRKKAAALQEDGGGGGVVGRWRRRNPAVREMETRPNEGDTRERDRDPRER